MEEKHRQLLRACDEKGAYEFPIHFDYEALERDATKVAKALNEQLGLKTKFEGAAFNQDATFSIAIILTDYVQERDNLSNQPTIRFSNFGRLVTLTCADMLPDWQPGRIQAALENHCFHFVPVATLDTEYDGVMAGDGTFPTWWRRYFDWL